MMSPSEGRFARRRLALFGLAAAVALLPAFGETVRVRGEPVPFAPFPDRMSAFLWRNWFCVPARRLAETVGSSVSDLETVAAEMGLPSPQPEVLRQWRRRGYITVLRRNWHLLPVEQLLRVLDMTRSEFEFALKEDDFLSVKLGSVKPVCKRLQWDGPAVRSTAARRRRIAAILAEEGVDPAAVEERRFSFVEDLSRPDPAWKAKKFSSAFKSRALMSYFADFGDPLADPEIGTYPEGLLQKLSDVGITRITVPVVLSTMIADEFRPESAIEAERRIATLNRLVRRAEKCGIDTAVYFNEPRAQSDSFFTASAVRESMRGGKAYQGYSICLSSEAGRRWFQDAIAQLYRRVPGLGGLGVTTASENQTHCASHDQQNSCPRCRKKSRRELIAHAVTVAVEAARRAAPDKVVNISTWGWPKDDVEWILRHVPHEMTGTGCTSEGGLEIERGGVKSVVGEYSISAGGPSPRSIARWRLASSLGMRTRAATLTGGTWEFSVIPALPTLDLLADHAFALKELKVDDVSLSWSVGCYPSPNQLVFSRMDPAVKSPGEVLDRVALEWYGQADAVPAIRRAWTAFSDGFREYPFHVTVVYRAPIHMGPANPLYAERTGWEATMVGIPYDDLDNWRSIYPAETWIAQMEKVGDGFERGCRLWEEAASRLSGQARSRAVRELGTYRAALLHFRSVCDQARFVLCRDRGDKEEMKRIASRELAAAKALLPLVRADARIGYECSNHYFYTPYDLMEKIVGCRQMMAAGE